MPNNVEKQPDNKRVEEESAQQSMGRKEQSDRRLGSTIIEPFKQFKIGIYVVVLTLLFTGLALILFMYSFWQQYQHVMSIFEVVDPKMQWELITNDVFRSNVIKVFLLFSLFILIVMAVVFRITHRYYGPLISIERFVDKVADGDYSHRISIRRSDEMARLVGKLNAMATQLEQRHRQGESESSA